MPQEMVRVSFRQVLTDPDSGMPLDTIPMQLWAGFVGVEEDAKTHALSPKIGWLARIADEESDEVARLKEEDKHMELYIHIGKDQEVPHALSKMDHIRSLRLEFGNNPVVIPEWLDKIQIDKLRIMGQFTEEEETQLHQRFPKAEIQRFEDIFKRSKLVLIKESKETEPVKAGDKIGGLPADGKKQTGLPIPVREVDNATKPIDMSEFEYEGLVFVADSLVGHAPPRDFPFAEVNDEGVTNENNPRIQVSLSDEEQTLVMSVNDLGFNLFRKVGADESILLSPLGMTYALGLINNGAGGKTRTQINQVLGCDDKKAANNNKFCRKMLTETPKLDKLATIDISNEFTSHKNIQPKPAFKEVAKDSYDTKFMASESDQLKFTLVNTINFKGIWTDKFPKAYTQDEMFKGEDGKEQTVPMMNQTRQFFYTENDLCQTLCLPYSNGAYQMIVLLPKEGKTVKEVAQSLTADSWEKMYDQMRRVRVDVKLPRFESESEVNLTGIMSALMPNAFNMKKADFSNLFDLESCIKMIKQKGRIKVDETGTEAWVATALQGRIAGLDFTKPETIVFHATHPFLYFIREWSTSTIFFIGQYMGS